MKTPTEQPDGYYIVVNDNTQRKRKHLHEDCPVLERSKASTFKPASVIEHLATCQMCEGESNSMGASGEADIDRCSLCGEEGVSRLRAHLPCGESDE